MKDEMMWADITDRPVTEADIAECKREAREAVPELVGLKKLTLSRLQAVLLGAVLECLERGVPIRAVIEPVVLACVCWEKEKK